MGISERKEKQKTELRQMILDASVKLFVEEGFEKVSIRKIAEIIEYSPTTVYLYFKDKNEILFNLHERGFILMEEYNKNLISINNPLLRLHKLGENYIQFGLTHPEFYDLMFLQPAPMEAINNMKQACEWKGGDDSLAFLKNVITECIEKKLIAEGDVEALAMAIWGMVHGLVSLAIRQRLNKLVAPEEVVPTMHKALNWMVNTMEK